jgi:hypothetical protein
MVGGGPDALVVTGGNWSVVPGGGETDTARQRVLPGRRECRIRAE